MEDRVRKFEAFFVVTMIVCLVIIIANLGFREKPKKIAPYVSPQKEISLSDVPESEIWVDHFTDTIDLGDGVYYFTEKE